VGFDFHKWLHVPYDAGCVLIRHGKAHQLAFSGRPHYLQSAQRGLAGGGSWPCEYGPELSRGFRALKVWFAMKEHGVRKFGELIWQNCLQAQYLASLIQARPELELLAQPELNIVCFRYRAEGLSDQELDTFNRELVADLQECGLAAPSTTSLSGKLAIRAALTNHRTRREDLQLLADSVVELGDRRRAEMREHPSNA
jgi:glutamate/tyrosine decarboxylase-like PLP-dependent enzyme